MKRIIIFVLVLGFVLGAVFAVNNEAQDTYEFTVTNEVSDSFAIAFGKAGTAVNASTLVGSADPIDLGVEAPQAALTANGDNTYSGTFFISYGLRSATVTSYSILLDGSILTSDGSPIKNLEYSVVVTGGNSPTLTNTGNASAKPQQVTVYTGTNGADNNYVVVDSFSCALTTGTLPDKTANLEKFTGTLTLTLQSN